MQPWSVLLWPVLQMHREALQLPKVTQQVSVEAWSLGLPHQLNSAPGGDGDYHVTVGAQRHDVTATVV